MRVRLLPPSFKYDVFKITFGNIKCMIIVYETLICLILYFYQDFIRIYEQTHFTDVKICKVVLQVLSSNSRYASVKGFNKQPRSRGPAIVDISRFYQNLHYFKIDSNVSVFVLQMPKVTSHAKNLIDHKSHLETTHDALMCYTEKCLIFNYMLFAMLCHI